MLFLLFCTIQFEVNLKQEQASAVHSVVIPDLVKESEKNLETQALQKEHERILHNMEEKQALELSSVDESYRQQKVAGEHAVTSAYLIYFCYFTFIFYQLSRI